MTQASRFVGGRISKEKWRGQARSTQTYKVQAGICAEQAIHQAAGQVQMNCPKAGREIDAGSRKQVEVVNTDSNLKPLMIGGPGRGWRVDKVGRGVTVRYGEGLIHQAGDESGNMASSPWRSNWKSTLTYDAIAEGNRRYYRPNVEDGVSQRKSIAAQY